MYLSSYNLSDSLSLALPIVSMATDANNATIVIDENDNARGIFQLSSTTFSASEGDTSAITVSRTAGTYGEVYIHVHVHVSMTTPPGQCIVDNHPHNSIS